MNFVKKLNLHWFCTQNHIFEPFSVRRACTKIYVTSGPYTRRGKFGLKICAKLERKLSRNFAARTLRVSEILREKSRAPPPPPGYIGLRVPPPLYCPSAPTFLTLTVLGYFAPWEYWGGGGGGGAQRPGGSTQLYCCTHARPQVFRTHPKHVLSIGQIYTLFKYFRVLFWQFGPLNKYNP